jgi:hypothetical protein
LITKALIEVKITDDSYKVRIPILDKVQKSSLNTDTLQTAFVCKQLSGNSNFNVGDIVYVDFEDNSMLNPVILGGLYYKKNKDDYIQNINFNSLEIKNSAKFSKETVIGNIYYNNILNLKNTSSNIQNQLDNLTDVLNKNKVLITSLINKINSNNIEIKKHKQYINSIKNNFDYIDKIFGNELNMSNSTILGKLDEIFKSINELEIKIGHVDYDTNILNELSDLESRLLTLKNGSPKIVLDDNQYEENIDLNINSFELSNSKKFDDLLAALRRKFPDNKYWNHMPYKGTGKKYNNQDGWTDIPCTTHNNHCGTSEQTCNGYAPAEKEIAWQCFGYASKCGYDMTGYDPTSSSKWKRVEDPNYLSKLKKGDIVRYKKDGHSIYITKVIGSTVEYTDCNSDSHCKIKWDRKIDKSTLAKTLSYILISPTDYSNSRLFNKNNNDVGQ